MNIIKILMHENPFSSLDLRRHHYGFDPIRYGFKSHSNFFFCFFKIYGYHQSNSFQIIIFKITRYYQSGKLNNRSIACEIVA
jgi:hypothetical protein